MSLNRLIARLATVSALNNYLEEPWPTLAGPNIFDSKIEPVEDMKLDRVFPCVVVYTDYDKDYWNKSGFGGKDRLMSITLELLIVQAQPSSTEEPDTYRLDCPQTDSEIETSLDMLEVQVFRALTAGTVASDALSYICPSASAVISRRGASTEGGQRLAARQITLEMKAIRDNIAGTIPDPIALFLNELEQHEDYRARVGEIRSMMTATASDTDFKRAMAAFGYGRPLAAMLGGEPDPEVILPPNLTFHMPGSSP